MPMPATSFAPIRACFIAARTVASDRRPDLVGIVLDFAGCRINLAQFLLRGGERPQLCVEDNRAGGGRALINRDECRRQLKSPAIIDGNSISWTSSAVQARPPALWTPAGRSCFAATIHRRRSAPIHFDEIAHFRFAQVASNALSQLVHAARVFEDLFPCAARRRATACVHAAWSEMANAASLRLFANQTHQAGIPRPEGWIARSSAVSRRSSAPVAPARLPPTCGRS